MLTINASDKNYPALLSEIHNPPPIYYGGRLPEKGELCVAVVGTRKATDHGRKIAKQFAERLAGFGITIVSGLAMGIDTAAHEGALSAGGKTIAVLGRGLDYIYPAQNTGLAKKITANSGALVSEYPPGEPTYPGNFIARNRIISGLSVGIIVIEAPEESGALATASFALEQNREVFVIPGPAGHVNYTGSHKLLRDGARLVTKPEDILEDLNLINPAESEQKLPFLNLKLTTEQSLIMETIKNIGMPVGVDKIQEISKIGTSDINRCLTHLLIKGIVKESSGLYSVQ